MLMYMHIVHLSATSSYCYMASHLRKLSTILKVYGMPAALIIGWWMMAFEHASGLTLSPRFASEYQSASNTPPHESILFPVERNRLQDALAGNTLLMDTLILEWDINSRLLQSRGITPIHRLSEDDFLRAQTISKKLKSSKRDENFLPQDDYRTDGIVDDAGHTIVLSRPFHKFLPQTYSAASFLLALTTPSSIVALPKRLRDHEQLYPKSLTEQIPLDIDRYNAEKLFEARPELAFVSHYSHPATIQTLSSQGIELYMMKNLDSLSVIYEELVNIGRIIDRPLEAEMLAIFMKAAMASIENELTLHARHLSNQNKALPKVLFLYHHQNYSVPTLKGLTGHLLERIREWDISLKYISDSERPDSWAMPINKEQILNLKPDCLIIAAQGGQPLEKDIREDPALGQLSAVCNNHIYFVDEAVQQSPSQYIVLAYYDLVNVLAGFR